MADINPFLGSPQQWVEQLAQLRAQRQVIEGKEDRLKTKLRAYLDEKKIDELAADKFVARIERRESTDFSQKALTEHLGEKKFSALKAALPVKVSESLTIRELKKEVEEDAELGNKFVKHFGGAK